MIVFRYIVIIVFTGLLMACTEKPSKSTQTDSEASPEVVLERCDTALVEAVKTSDPRLLSALIAQKANLNCEAADSYSIEPLIVKAIKESNLEIVKLLLDAGINIHVRDRYGHTPLLVAISWAENEKIIDLLIEAGSDIYAETATKKGDRILSFGGENMLLLAAYSKHSDLPRIQKIMNTGCCDINARSLNGRTPFMAAVYSNKGPEIIQYLLEAGSDIHVKYYGSNALMQAAKENTH